MRKGNTITTGFHLPYNPLLKDRAQELRNHMTQPEKKLWFDFLSQYPIRFLRQKPIEHYIVDFYCASHKVVIEIDGEGHFTPEGKAYDKERSVILEGYGIRVLRFTNTDVMKDFEEVCRIIKKEVGNNT